MAHVIRFEIHASDTARARKFYGDLFGWRFQELPGPIEHWMITTGPDAASGIHGGLLKRMGGPPVDGQAVNSFICTLGGIEDLDATVRAALSGGGVVALPKMAIPGIGWLAYLKDTEGNLFGVAQEDKTAK